MIQWMKLSTALINEMRTFGGIFMPMLKTWTKLDLVKRISKQTGENQQIVDKVVSTRLSKDKI